MELKTKKTEKWKNKILPEKYVGLFLFITTLAIIIVPKTIYATDYASTGAALGSGMANAASGWLFNITFSVLSKILAFVTSIPFLIANFSLWVSGGILDLSISYTVKDFQSLVSDTSIVNIGWVIVRDLSNMVFIFLILWIGIQTILGLQHGNAMGSVLRIAVAAILVNFSLFITKAVIDVSNIFALHFWNLITKDGTSSLSGIFMKNMSLQSFYNAKNLLKDWGTDEALVNLKIIMIYIIGTVTVMIAAWALLTAAVIFVIRAIYLIVLMILSPLAFIAWVVPGFSGTTHDWWNRLFKQAFFAPIFLIMIYIVGLAIEKGAIFNVNKGSLDWASLASAGLGNSSTITPDSPAVAGLVINFLLTIGMLISSLIIANKLGAKGSDTMMSWGKSIRNAGQSWVAGRTIGMGARWADERLSKTWIGNTGIGKTIRERTTIALKDTKWGGKMSAEERHREDLELESKRKEAAEISGKPFAKHPEDNAVALLAEIEKTKTDGQTKLSAQEAIVKRLEEEVKTDPNKKAELDDAKSKYKEARQEVSDELEKSRGELQKILVRLTPHSFAEMMPKELLFSPELMRNASRAQMMAVLGSDNFAEIEKDKVRAARYGHIKDANEKVEKENEGYEKKYEEYKNFFNFEPGENLETKIKKEVDKFGFAEGSDEQKKKKEEIGAAIELFQGATNDEEKKTAVFEGLKTLKKPEKKMIGDVAPDVRTWIRAMADQEVDEMYRFDPKLVLNPNVASTLRSSVTRYMRQSENIASIDKDKMRDAKLGIIIDAEDLSSGLGELAPTFQTFKEVVQNLIKAGAKDLEVLNDLIPNEASFKKYQGFSKENAANWESLKEDYLRKAVKKIAFEKGTYQQYLDSFNLEQTAIASLGKERMVDAIAGYSNDEYPILRGLRWRHPVFAKMFTRGIAQEFRQKDTGDIKEVMDMLLWDFKNYLANPDDQHLRISRDTLDFFHWVATEQSGKAFKNRTVINPALQETFDKMLAIFSKMGRNKNITYKMVEELIKKLNRGESLEEESVDEEH